MADTEIRFTAAATAGDVAEGIGASTLTDELGRYDITLRPGVYNIAIRLNGSRHTLARHVVIDEYTAAPDLVGLITESATAERAEADVLDAFRALVKAAQEAADRAVAGAIPGAPGPQGPAGDPGQIRFTGRGAPGTIQGASPNDTYLDLDSGTIYKLE
ncbi:hypothetical protein [Salinisphaera sp. T31B1]|uniref:hypothetical protein n=1 Tax=Salinisphaera sp. T31B1 TaxID=727963 RepID=UPI00333FAA5A